MSDSTATDYQILLYYNYTTIADPESLMEQQRQLCQKLGLKGRIIIATEGINGTLEGLTAATEDYVAQLLADPRFSNTHIKRSAGTGSAFRKLSVKVRPEIVSGHLGDADVNPTATTGHYLTPEQLHTWINSDKEFYIVDMRNDYEHAAGHFAGSILPKLGHFRDLSAILPAIGSLKNKTVVTVCTGGVRCEKASGFLIQQGFADVYQLYGGIVSYMEKYPNQDFLGKLYVFDKRILMGFNTTDSQHQIVGRCQRCQQPSEEFINCAWDDCHRHFILCATCQADDIGPFCSADCQQHLSIAV